MRQVGAPDDAARTHRIERDPEGVPLNTPYRVNDVELASRLSFFLWSSIPDDELLAVAESGKLKDSAVLAQQMKRMLADPRASALVNNFSSQWLYLRNLRSASPDPNEYPDFDENLRMAFQKETELLIESTIREDRSVLDLLNANYTFVNERLARHYGIPGIYGSRFRRVALPNREQRGWWIPRLATCIPVFTYVPALIGTISLYYGSHFVLCAMSV